MPDSVAVLETWRGLRADSGQLGEFFASAVARLTTSRPAVMVLRSGRRRRLACRVAEIRRARKDDFKRLQEIERAAGQAFVDIGYDWVAQYEPFTEAELRHFLELDGLWVSGDPAAAYIATETVDGLLHIEQVSVHPDHAHQRIGQALIEHVASRVTTAVTLTTFAEVPFNGPYYERLGFRPLADNELTDGLRRIRRHETDLGLDIRPRLAMRREAGTCR